MVKKETKKTKKSKVRALVLFSGGLDSRLAVKMMQEQGIEPICVMFKLPFGGGCCNDEMCSFKFSQLQGAELKIIDCTKGKLFNEFLDMLKIAKHGTGAGANPCIDCRIYIMERAKPMLKTLNCDFIVTGEVLGERPMSQYKTAMQTIEEEAKLDGLILRPLSAKLLEPTQPEKDGLVDRSKLLDIQGRNRTPQMTLAKKYKIDYPHPGGGCLLCEKDYAAKLRDLYKHLKLDEITPEHIILLRGFRHFRTKNGKIILGKDHKENLLLEQVNKNLKQNINMPKNPGPTAIYENKDDEKLSNELIEAYSSKDLKKREKFEKYRLQA